VIKLIYLFSKRPGMTLDEFRTYYEEKHLRIFDAQLKSPELGQYITRHVRRYLTPVKDRMSDVTRSEFDAILEIWFRSEEAYDAYINSPIDADLRKVVIEDEERFLDRSRTQCYVVDERDASIPGVDRPPIR